MSDLIVIARDETSYACDVVSGLCSFGKPPSIVFVGSGAQRILFKLSSLRRIWRQLGPLEAMKRIQRSKEQPSVRSGRSSPSIDSLSRNYGFEVEKYDIINQGSMIVRILTAKQPITVLAGCGIVDKALIDASSGRCLNGHPAWLPGLRGVDVFEWSILKDVPFGVTAHLVDEKVDAGKIILRRRLVPVGEKNFWTFSERLRKAQADVLVRAAIMMHAGKAESIENSEANSELCLAMPDRLHAQARRKFQTKLA